MSVCGNDPISPPCPSKTLNTSSGLEEHTGESSQSSSHPCECRVLSLLCWGSLLGFNPSTNPVLWTMFLVRSEQFRPPCGFESLLALHALGLGLLILFNSKKNGFPKIGSSVCSPGACDGIIREMLKLWPFRATVQDMQSPLKGTSDGLLCRSQSLLVPTPANSITWLHPSALSPRATLLTSNPGLLH